ncbi:hypothetical protein OH77DRAFT_1520899 [Trametes cingulata]|nr:hypothetical protein OH77DRAFT_1520899 [Trametes cingulata]
MGSPSINVDDHDTNYIIYQNPPLWRHELGAQDVQRGTYTAGYTNAVAKFSFNGTEVMVYGVANPAPSANASSLPPSVSFIVDGSTTNQVSSPPTTDSQYSYLFYDSGPLSPGQHTLQILVNNGDSDWPFILDFIQYIPLPSSASPTVSVTSSSMFSSTSSLLATPTAPQEDVHALKQSRPVGAIAGAALAGLVGLGLLVTGIWFYFTRLRERQRYKRYARTKLDLLEHEPKTHAPSIHPSTAAGSSYTGDSYPCYRPSLGPDSIYAPTELGRPFSPQYASGSSSPSVGYKPPTTPPAVLRRPETPSIGMMDRPSTPPTIYQPVPITLYPPGAVVPDIPLPINKAAQAEADRASIRSARRAALFHADSGIRFSPPIPVSGETQGLGGTNRQRESALSEVPPEYTED